MCDEAEQQIQVAIGDNCDVPIDNKGGCNKLPFKVEESMIDTDEFAKGIQIAALVAPMKPSQQAGADPEDIQTSSALYMKGLPCLQQQQQQQQQQQLQLQQQQLLQQPHKQQLQQRLQLLQQLQRQQLQQRLHLQQLQPAVLLPHYPNHPCPTTPPAMCTGPILEKL